MSGITPGSQADLNNREAIQRRLAAVDRQLIGVARSGGVWMTLPDVGRVIVFPVLAAQLNDMMANSSTLAVRSCPLCLQDDCRTPRTVALHRLQVQHILRLRRDVGTARANEQARESKIHPVVPALSYWDEFGSDLYQGQAPDPMHTVELGMLGKTVPFCILTVLYNNAAAGESGMSIVVWVERRPRHGSTPVRGARPSRSC